MRIVLSSSLLTLLLAASPLLGQAGSLEPGTRLRVQGPDRQVVGTLARWEADSLVVREWGGDLEALGTAQIESMERQVGRGSGARRGALWGGVIGVGLGLALGLTDTGPGPGEYTDGTVVRMTALLGVIGVGVGTWFGWVFGEGEWEEVPLER